MKKTSPTIACLAIVLGLFPTFSFAENYSRDAVIADFDYLYSALKEAHYNINAYTSAEELDSRFTGIKSSMVEESYDHLSTVNLFHRFVSSINNGHTELDFPVGAYRQYAVSGGTIFPIEIALQDGKALVRKNFSSEQAIEIGSEIIRINGETIPDILAKIYPFISAERTYFKNAKLELFSFPRYYWRAYGRVDTFDVEVASGEGAVQYSVLAVDLIEGFEQKREEILNASMRLAFFDKIAYLSPGDFSGNEEIFKSFIDDSFVTIREKGSKTLILDFRNNSGGHDAFSDYLVTYIADQPFRWASRLSIKSSKFLKDHTRANSDLSNVYFQEILAHEDGDFYDYPIPETQPQPVEKRFHGEVYVLVNRQSHSMATVAAAQIQDYGFATIVGEETGEYPTLYASQFQFALPNTGIIIKVSKGYIVRVNGSEKAEGLIPDILIRDHLLDEDDEILDGLLVKLRN